MKFIDAKYNSGNGSNKQYITKYYCSNENECIHMNNGFCSSSCPYVKKNNEIGYTTRTKKFYKFQEDAQNFCSSITPKITFKSPMIYVVGDYVVFCDINLSEQMKNNQNYHQKYTSWHSSCGYIKVEDFTYEMFINEYSNLIFNNIYGYNCSMINSFLIHIMISFPYFFELFKKEFQSDVARIEDVNVVVLWKNLIDNLQHVYKNEYNEISNVIKYSKIENTCQTNVVTKCVWNIKGSNFVLTYNPAADDDFCIDKIDDIKNVLIGNPFLCHKVEKKGK